VGLTEDIGKSVKKIPLEDKWTKQTVEASPARGDKSLGNARLLIARTLIMEGTDNRR